MKYTAFRFIRFWVRIFYPKITVEGTENLPEEPYIAVGNHAKMNGPITCELYYPGRHYTWTAGEMMKLSEVPAYAYKDFWSYKPVYIRWFYKILSYAVAPIASIIFNNASCIGVYHDMRIMSTFRESVAKLEEGACIVIFPEHYVPYNNLVWEFQDRFVDTARMFYRKTGKEISFVPMYVAPRLKKLYFGKPVKYDHTADKDAERKRIAHAMMEGITEIAKNLPEHIVVPYPNMPEREYPTNKDYNIVSDEDKTTAKRIPEVEGAGC